MADVLYVGLQEDDKIVTFGIDAGGAKLVPKAETPAVGGPSAFAVSPDRRALYVGYRGTPGIESCRIDPASGALTSLRRVADEHAPTYLAADRAGKFLLSAYYQGAYAAVHPLGSDGAVSGPALDRQNTAPERTRSSRNRRTASPSYRTSRGSRTTCWSRRRTSPARISSRSSDSTRPPGGSTRTASSSRRTRSGHDTIVSIPRSISCTSPRAGAEPTLGPFGGGRQRPSLVT